MSGIGPTEILIVLVLALIVLGPRRLPSAGRSLGEGLRGFKDAVSGDSSPKALASGEDAPARTE
jgi:sec-independent protein translocase protein TatA